MSECNECGELIEQEYFGSGDLMFCSKQCKYESNEPLTLGDIYG
jgi:hypothetical protein